MNRVMIRRVFALVIVLVFSTPVFPQTRLGASDAQPPASEAIVSAESAITLSDFKANPAEIPQSHPAFDIKKGGVNYYNGIPFEYYSGESLVSESTAAVLPEDVDEFRSAEAEIEGIDNAARHPGAESREQYAFETAEIFGEEVSEQRREELKFLYSNLEEASRQLDAGLVEDHIELEAAIEHMADEIVAFSKGEMQVYAEMTKAADEPPSPNPLKGKTINPRLEHDMRMAYAEFLRGAWMQEEKERMKKSWTYSLSQTDDARRKAAIPISQLEGFKRTLATALDSEDLRQKDWAAVLNCASGVKDQLTAQGIDNVSVRKNTKYKDVGEPTYTHFEFRVYTPEHIVISEYPRLGRSASLTHTSVVAGAWAYRKQVRVRESEFGRGRKEYTEYIEEPVCWLIGNGCAGAYLENEDKLVLRHVWIFDDFLDLLKFAYGVKKDMKDSAYHKVRSASYSVGAYGFNWVCQNMANAFTKMKWNIDVFPRDFSFWTWSHGLYGRKGITPDMDTSGEAQPGCIPGVGCYYNITRPYISVPRVAVYIESKATGIGTGLKCYWDPVLEQCIESGAMYEEFPIPYALPLEGY